MRLSLRHSLIATVFVRLTAALQTIYFGTIGSSAGPYQCIAFFSDADPCFKANTTFGDVFCSGNYCKEGPITIQGHDDIRFTGCKPNPNLGGPEYVPKGVSDDGTPALKCKPPTNPPGSLYGAYASCAPGEGYKNVGFVNVDAYCS